MIDQTKIAVIDLFCGIGGLSQGFVAEGFDVIAGYDNDPSCKFAFESNNNSTFYEKDIMDLKGSELNQLFGNKIKISKNIKRDKEKCILLHNLGWHTMTVWSCQLKSTTRKDTLEEIVFLLQKIFLEQNKI